MTKNTDSLDVVKTIEQFQPKDASNLSEGETALLWELLELGTRNAIEFMNIRYLVTTLYDQEINQILAHGDSRSAMNLMDIKSAVCKVVDSAAVKLDKRAR